MQSWKLQVSVADGCGLKLDLLKGGLHPSSKLVLHHRTSSGVWAVLSLAIYAYGFVHLPVFGAFFHVVLSRAETANWLGGFALTCNMTKLLAVVAQPRLLNVNVNSTGDVVNAY